METTADDLLNGIAIRPPRLEDAGLEDCALPPDSIMEAFSRAAGALKSRIIPDGHGCVHDPGPSNGEIPDALIDTSGGGIPAKPVCGGEGETVGGGGGGDEVIVVGGGTEEDRVVVLGGDDEAEGKKSCVVDGDGGIEGGVEVESEKGRCDEDDDDDDDKPRLVGELI